MGIKILLDLVGGVALLLWGLHMVHSGIVRAFGAKIRRFLGSVLKNRFHALMAGIGVTAALQSSTATALMLSSFSASGLVDLAPALGEGWAAGGGAAADAPRTSAVSRTWSGAPSRSFESNPGRIWVDLQNDVTTKDIGLAYRESYVSVEHLKRYTTLGMATDQGKTSNVNGLAVLASLEGRTLGEAGVTTFRPPYAPVSFAAIAARHRGEHSHPVKRLPAENERFLAALARAIGR